MAQVTFTFASLDEMAAHVAKMHASEATISRDLLPRSPIKAYQQGFDHAVANVAELLRASTLNIGA